MRKYAKVLVGMALVLFAVSFVACGSKGPSIIRSQSQIIENFSYDMSVITTVGNRSYIPINIGGRPDQNVALILGVLKKFEEEKQVEVVSWQVDKRQVGYATSAKIFGIWIEHRPKK